MSNPDADKTITYISGMKVIATLGHYTPIDYWNNRFTLFADNREREKNFNEMSYDDTELIKDRVKNALEGMYDSVDAWLPSGFKSFEPGNKIVIEFEMLVLDHDLEIERRKKAVSMQARDMRSKLLDILAEEDQAGQ